MAYFLHIDLIYDLAMVGRFLISISFSTSVSITLLRLCRRFFCLPCSALMFCMHLCSDTANKCWPAVKFGSAIGKIYIYILMPESYAPRCNQILVYYCRYPLQRMSRGMCLTCFASSDCSWTSSPYTMTTGHIRIWGSLLSVTYSFYSFFPNAILLPPATIATKL